MNLLISCCKPGGGVYTLDTQTGRIEQVLADDTSGIEQLPDGRILRVLRSEDMLEVVDPKTWKPLKMVTLPKRRADYHDVRLQENGIITLVATNNTAVDMFDLNLDYLGSFALAAGFDPWHMNSIIMRNGGEILITAFSTMPVDEGWRRMLKYDKWGEGGVMRLNGGSMEQVVDDLRAPHSLIDLHDGTFALADSLRATLVHFKGSTIEMISVMDDKGRPGGFMRGLYKKNDRWYAGLSSHRGGPEVRSSGVVELDEDGKIMRKWTIRSPEIYDVKEVRL